MSSLYGPRAAVTLAMRTIAVALGAAALAVLVAPKLANAGATSLAAQTRPGCVLCDSCNGGSGNHVTSDGGGREGVEHSCFTGSTCLVHEFNSSCGQQEEDAAEGATVSWKSLQEMDGRQLAAQVSRAPNRLRVRADLGTVQVTDCFGNLVASLPMSVSKVAAVAGTALTVN